MGRSAMLSERAFLAMAQEIALLSPDPSTKVGAVLTNGLAATFGFNGFPHQTRQDEELYANRDQKYLRVVHAEIRAALNWQRSRENLRIYTTLMPCAQCTAFLIEFGVFAIFCPEPSGEVYERWGDSFRASTEMCNEAGVGVFFT